MMSVMGEKLEKKAEIWAVELAAKFAGKSIVGIAFLSAKQCAPNWHRFP